MEVLSATALALAAKSLDQRLSPGERALAAFQGAVTGLFDPEHMELTYNVTVGMVSRGGPKEGGVAPRKGPALSAIKEALKKVREIVGKLPKGLPGSFGSPQAGTQKKGYRLDPPHPNARPGTPETGPHINWWDYTSGKRGNGGKSGAQPIKE